ncbi:Glycosylphosphatidylinositol:protein transamidase, GAA1 component [Aureobasidium pullulans EXF-150]|uniref:Glycosylphosphatidylinositol:protein transamidase, GAA1 component n=1 Tax=Aureobasidium pullulans EXF-150 TaxID=1043002 RepID=A0A074X3T2_AURPU|nr:Glycosylphosphatidylinositol:protein transamidase, GAA1 component [Aureobasidium pullulans EXF-150]KEQ80140.1 Glycosylphosphatidylinositol:protein transamidase, GAA1 component [Aureobasidium pullulans EXF-150]
MAALLSGLLSLRHNRRLARIPPYLSALCIIIGVAWLLLLPLDEYSRRTYVSENAILPGQVHTYFGGSEHNVFRAYRQEIATMDELSTEDRSQKLYQMLGANGLKPDIQNYAYSISGQNKTGQNVYALLQGPRADATEAMVMIAAWRNMDGKINYSGVALLLTLARYFKRWSIWSKDIIVLIPSDSTYGPHAWVDAYHDTHDTTAVDALKIKAGALQAAIAIDYPAGPWGHRFEKLHVVYDGINGQLPNLDLVNTAVNIAQGQLGISCTIQRMWNHQDSYRERLDTMLRGMMNQAVGHASGPHSVFMPYHIDAITLQTVGDGWHDEISLGRTVESLFRSVNNLLEHLHQSFFFYLLMQANRFVSIGTYLPSAMLIAVNFTITCILLWVQSGQPKQQTPSPASPKTEKKPDMTLVKEGESVALVPTADLEVVQRDLFSPLAIVLGVHALGLVPFYVLNQIPEKTSLTMLAALMLPTITMPAILAFALRSTLRLSPQTFTLIQCFSLLLLGAALSTLATLNFSQALFVGLLASPLSFVRPFSPPRSWPIAVKVLLGVLSVVVMVATSPPAALQAFGFVTGKSFDEVIAAAAWAWRVERVWTGVTIWVLWWPAWVCGGLALCSGFIA